MANPLAFLNRSVGQLFSKEGRFTAIDIGSSSVKLIEVDGSMPDVRVRAYGSMPLSASAIQNNMVHDPAEVATAIRSAADQAGISAKPVVTAVPGPAVIIKKIQLPQQSEQELETSVLFEAGNFIPESLENVNLDYQVTDVLEGEGQVEVLLVAVKKEIINSYTNAIRGAGFEPAIVDVDYFALENMFELNYDHSPGEVVALVNVGARYSCINILKGGRSTFTGDVPVGGKEFNDALVRSLGISAEEAEAAKMGMSDSHPMEEIEPLLQPVREFLAEEIHRALSFFWTAATDESISNVCVSGGAAQVPGFAELLAERLETTVSLASPFARVKLGSGIDREALQMEAPSFAVAMGLGVRRPGDK